MKIAFIGTRGVPANYGGTESYVEKLTHYFASEGDEVVVYCKKSDNKQEKARLDAMFPDNVKRVEMPSIPTKHLDNITRSFFSTLHACLDRKIDVVQFNNAGPSFFAIIPRLFGKKVVGAIRAIDSQREKWNFLAKAFLRFCDFLIVKVPHATTVNSMAMKEYYGEKYNAETAYIPNGVVVPDAKIPASVIHEYGLQEKKYILFAARLEPEKGCHVLIDAYKKAVAETGSDIKLAIAGHTGFTSDYFNALFSQKSDDIKFLGYVDANERLSELFDHAYAFVLPSSVEGMSNSLLKAMAHGVPSVVSDIPENLAVFDEAPFDEALGDRPGLSFRLDDVDDLAARLVELFNDAEKAALRGRLLKEHVEKHFTMARMFEDTRKVYTDLLT
ncbi:MAG: glycosyltransferase family 4 protein [Gammaproteobacteria bacterium]|nr:glycosyltransferase family 4 protein [Gammaproteobacteria bacterium]